ncbi:receptor-like protein EIX1 isoform X2 [Benincasa hispida]|uniref:receptor-like protein EIX1 isoform X2 n=1 Tax=Benincasa hispida TaxID=102211 RepID=UPI00190072F3|nr:receptor-like protein EIX1 isoform X2 [Benincasa hispida]
MRVSMALIWYFASIHLILLLSVSKNVAHLELNGSVKEKIRCMEKERVALLSFKQKLVDEYDILSSWDTDVNSDCCNWKGVECSNTTTTHHHIIGLDLHASDNYERCLKDIIPHWFWTNLSANLYYIDLSGNKIMGEIPDLPLNYFKGIQTINFESNKFVGRIPAFLFQSRLLSLSNNNFSDLTCLCKIGISPLKELDLSNNQLSRQLPNCWDSMDNLEALKLSDNYFSGDLPHSMSSLIHLNTLLLRNNQFCGGFDSLSSLSSLKAIDAMNNNLFGAIPSWIGSKLPNLTYLNLKSNNFYGNLPSSICNLKRIHVLDISSNNISGSIPTCIHNFQAFKQTSDPSNDFDVDDNGMEFIFWKRERRLLVSAGYEGLVMVLKGKERLIIGKVLRFERFIDLSCNHLTGKIPDEITELVGLITLNLSNNELTGPIPGNMGQLQSLDSLDLSRNHLYGPIPATLSQISRLSVLDLSYNNLSGKIPTSTQLQSFQNSSYEGNPYLCGDPLKKCFNEIPREPNDIHVNENKNEDSWFVLGEFFISMTFGYIVGFWGIFGTLLLHKRWRHAYFKFLMNTIH